MVNTATTPEVQDPNKMKVQELRAELAARGLETSGLKSELVQRLESHVPDGAEEGEAKEEDIAKKDMDIDEHEKVDTKDSSETEDVVEVAVAQESSEEDPKAVDVDGSSPKPVTAVAHATNGVKEKAIVVPAEVAAPETTVKPATSDLERKQKRAERFGLELMVSEVEKRRLRAARFGSSPTNGTEKSPDKTTTGEEGSKMSPTIKEMETAKRKARAARFGIEEVSGKLAGDVPPTSAASTGIDDAKKKARLARFGLTVKVDEQEQEKKKLRAARFGLDAGAESKVDSASKVEVAPPAATI